MCCSFGKRVRNLREDRAKNLDKKSWSLQALASRINVSSQALSDIETEKTKNPGLEIIKSLSEEFNVSTDYLIFGKERFQTLIFEIPECNKYMSNIKVKLTRK